MIELSRLIRNLQTPGTTKGTALKILGQNAKAYAPLTVAEMMGIQKNL